MKGFILGIVVTLAAMILGAYVFVKLGLLYPGQDAGPGKFETWAAANSLATIGRRAKGVATPMQPTEASLTAGAHLYVTHCQVCHGGADAAPSPIAKGLTPNPPQLAKDGVEDDPEGVTWWKIKHGIRFTGMPSFRDSLADPEIWQIALFLKHMDSLPPASRAAWTAAKPPR